MMQNTEQAKTETESRNGHASAKPSRKKPATVAPPETVIPALRVSEGQTDSRTAGDLSRCTAIASDTFASGGSGLSTAASIGNSMNQARSPRPAQDHGGDDLESRSERIRNLRLQGTRGGPTVCPV